MSWLPSIAFVLTFIGGIQVLAWSDRRRRGLPPGRFPWALVVLGWSLCVGIKGLRLVELGLALALAWLTELRDGR